MFVFAAVPRNAQVRRAVVLLSEIPNYLSHIADSAVSVVHVRARLQRSSPFLRLPKSGRRAVPVLLMMFGAAILFYVGTQYWTMYSEQRRLTDEWARQQQMSAPPLLQVNNAGAAVHDGLTRILIPKINLEAVIVEGTSHKALLRGPGHLTDTPAPGKAGNSVISAHRDTFFRHIYELSAGDLIDIQRDGHSYVYEVTGKKIVDSADLSVLRQTSDPQLTLITCYPTYFIGPAPERLIVFTKLSKDGLSRLSASAAKPEKTEKADRR